MDDGKLKELIVEVCENTTSFEIRIAPAMKLLNLIGCCGWCANEKEVNENGLCKVCEKDEEEILSLV